MTKDYYKYLLVCAWLNVTPMQHGDVWASGDPGFQWPQDHATHQCPQQDFVEIALADFDKRIDRNVDTPLEYLFKTLQLPLRRRQKGVISTILGC